MKNVVVIGLGYVGLPLAIRAAEKKYKVTGIDVDKDKVATIQDKKDPIGEDYIKEMLPKVSMQASSSFSAVEKADIVLICVPTPVVNGFEPDLGPVRGAVKSMLQHARKGALLIIESTINPGVCDEVITPLIEDAGLKINEDIHLAHCPERINPGDAKWDVTNIPRVVGASSPEGLDTATNFYESIVDAPIRKMGSIKEAEAVKVVENSFRDINIAFVNELAKSFSRLGIDVKNVIDGAATKPFAFMPHYPSVGVGGHCIPVDPYYLIEYAKQYGFDHEFLKLAREINNSMPIFTVRQAIDALNETGLALKDTVVGVLGLSYKPNVADDRESPSYKLIDHLRDKGAKVLAYDPYFLEKSDEKTLEDVVTKSEALILACNHDEFEKFNFAGYGLKAFVDGKNAIDKAKLHSSTVYRGIGRR